MTSIEERKTLFEQLAKDRGLDPVALRAQYKKEGHGRWEPELDAYGIQQLQVVTEDAPDIEGIYVGMQAQTIGGTSRTSLLIAGADGIRAVTVSPAPEIPLFAKVKVTKVSHSRNATTGSEWYTAPDASAVTCPGMATPDEVTQLFTPLNRVSGNMNQWWLFRGLIQFVNERPAEKYDPKKPRQQFQPGQSKEQIRKRPFYDPTDSSFAMSLQVVDGQDTIRVNVFDESVLVGLYPERYLKDDGGPEALLKWVRDPKVPDAQKVENIRNYLTRLEVVGLARGGDLPTRGGVQGTKLPTTTLTLRGGDGFLAVPEVFEGMFQPNGHSAPSGAGGASAPAAATPPPAPSAGDLVDRVFTHIQSVESGRMSTTKVSGLPKVFGVTSRELATAMKQLLKENRIKREGSDYIVPPTAEDDGGLSELGSEDTA